MNREKNKERRKLKRKRWQEKKRAKAAEERQKDRERRIEERAKQLADEREKEKSKATPSKNTSEERPAKKQRTSMLKEIDSNHVVRTQKHLGSGSYGSCFLAFYRGMTVVVKELKVNIGKRETEQEAKDRTKTELIHEAQIITQLGDHPGLPLLFGICSNCTPYQLILQFHGDGINSITIAKALYSKAITKKKEWSKIIVDTAKALDHIHQVGFLHNDLKTNNVVLDKRASSYTPVIIDFGKSRLITKPKAPKNLTELEQDHYIKNYPHIAPEILKGVVQSIASDVFSMAKVVERIYTRCKLGEMPQYVMRSLSPRPEERPLLVDFYVGI